MKRQILVLMAGLVLFATGAKAGWISYINYTVTASSPGGDSWSGTIAADNNEFNTFEYVSANGAPGATLTSPSFGTASPDSIGWWPADMSGSFNLYSETLYAAISSAASWDDLIGTSYALTTGLGADFLHNGSPVYGTLAGSIQFGYASSVPEPGMVGLGLMGGLLVVGVGRWVKGGSQKSPVAA